MSKRKKYTPQPFESVGGNNLSSNIYITMLQHPNFIALSNGAKVLYLHMKAQYYGAKIIDHPNTHFYFNWALYSKTYKLGTNKAQFEKYRNELIKYGFIELVEYGGYSKTKNIYAYSDKWQTGTTFDIPQDLIQPDEKRNITRKTQSTKKKTAVTKM